MDKSISKKLAEVTEALDLGIMLGQRKAFGQIAGRCSAAEAAAIRRIREERLYLATNLSWEDFCPARLGMCRSQADRLVRLLEEFGPDYFEVNQLTRIPPKEYRAISSAIREGHIHWLGEAVALLPENSEKVAAAVTGLRKQAAAAEPQPSAPEPEPAAPPQPAKTLEERTADLLAEWTGRVAVRCSLPPADRQNLKNFLGRTRRDLQRLECQVWN